MTTPSDPFVFAADVVERRVTWVWHRRLPQVGLAVIAGDGGVGKSTLVQKIGAAITRGEALPFGGVSGRPRGVLMLSAEEDSAAVIRPRLRLMGADLERVLLLDPEHGASFTLPSGTDVLDAACQDVDAGLVVIDSGPAFMDANLKSNTEEDIRRMLRPLATLAERRELLVVVLAHLNKGQGPASQRVMGGAAWRNAPRLLLLIGVPDQQHPGETDERMIAVDKTNLGRYPDAVSFRLVTFLENPDLADVHWGEEHRNVTSGDLVTAAADPEERSAINEATDWLSDALAHGPKPAAELQAAARKDGIADRTLRRASARLGVIKAKAGFRSGWEWSLPEGASHPPSVVSLATFAEKRAENRITAEGDRKAANPAALAPSGPFDGQALSGADFPEGGQLANHKGTLATLGVPRSTCNRCGMPWPGPGSVCEACLDRDAGGAPSPRTQLPARTTVAARAPGTTRCCTCTTWASPAACHQPSAIS